MKDSELYEKISNETLSLLVLISNCKMKPENAIALQPQIEKQVSDLISISKKIDNHLKEDVFEMKKMIDLFLLDSLNQDLFSQIHKKGEKIFNEVSSY